MFNAYSMTHHRKSSCSLRLMFISLSTTSNSFPYYFRFCMWFWLRLETATVGRPKGRLPTGTTLLFMAS